MFQYEISVDRGYESLDPPRPTVFPSKFIKLTKVSYLANNTLSEQNFPQLFFSQEISRSTKGGATPIRIT